MRVYLMFFVGILAFVLLLGFCVKHYIENSVEMGVSSRVCEQNLNAQNAAVLENELLKEQIAKHNQSTQQRFELLSQKYKQIQAKNGSCEAKLEALKEHLKVFYENK